MQVYRWCGSMVLALMVPLFGCASAPSDGPLASGRCTLEVILILKSGDGERPSDALIASLARQAGVSLQFVRAAGTRSHLYRLSSQGAAAVCDEGLRQLRSDSRVLAADVDGAKRAQSSGAVAAP